jgi:multisubunit Na+/H+ antiporter MnhF subunit
MPKTTILFGVILIVLGVVGYIATGAVSVTALIPSFFGGVLALLGWLALNERYRRHAMHIAVVVGLLGFLGTARGLAALPRLVSDPATIDRPAAVVAQAVMAILMIVYVSLGVRSFIAARRARTAR